MHLVLSRFTCIMMVSEQFLRFFDLFCTPVSVSDKSRRSFAQIRVKFITDTNRPRAIIIQIMRQIGEEDIEKKGG